MVMTSTNLSSPPSTCRLIEDGNPLQLRTHALQLRLTHCQPLEHRQPLMRHRLLTRHQLYMCQPHRVHRWQVPLCLTSEPSSTAIVVAKIAVSPLSASVRGVATSRVITSWGSSTLSHQREKHPQPAVRAACLLAPLVSREGAWSSLDTSICWSGHASSDPTCRRSTTGLSIPLNSYRSTPPQSLQ
jgi:hypothetical protein